MTTSRKWIARIGSSLAVLAAAILLLYWLVLPVYVENTIRNSLRQRGFSDASFSVESVSLSQMTLRDLRLDKAQTMTVRRVEVDYGLSDLWAGKVSEMRFVDATWKIRLSKDYVANWGPVAGLVKSEGARPPPVKLLRWLDSHLVVEMPGRTFRVALGGTAELFQDEMQIDLRGELFDEEIYIRARTDSRKRSGFLNGEMLGEVAPPGQRNWLSLTARFENNAGELALELEVQGHRHSIGGRAGRQDWALSDVTGNLKVRFQGDELRDAMGAVSASSAALHELQVLEPRLTLQREADVLAIELSAQLEQCSGSARGSLSPYPKEWLSAESFNGEWQVAGTLPTTLRDWLKEAGVIASELRLEASGRTRLTRDEKGWGAEVDNASVVIAASAIALPAKKLTIRGPSASLRFDARIAAGHGQIDLKSASQTTATSLRWGALSIRPALSASPALMVLAKDSTSIAWQESSLAWRSEGLRARLRAVLKYADMVQLRNLRGSIALSKHAAGTSSDARILWSRLRADASRMGKLELPNLSASIRGSPTLLRIDASSKITKTATLTVKTSLNRRGKRMGCSLAIELPPSSIKANDRLDSLIREFVPVSLTGSVALRAHLDPCRANAESGGQLRLTDVTAKHTKSEVALVGITSSIALTGLDPVRTEGWQELKWKRTRVRERNFGAGSIVLRAATPGRFEVRGAKLDIGGGTLWTSAFTLDPEEPEVQATFFARGVSLKKWLQILSRGRLRGTGLFSGRLGMRLQWKPQLQLQILGGHFRSDGPGHFTVNSRAWLRSVLERYAAGFSTGGEMSELVKDRLIGTLFDFDYSTFHAQIKSGPPKVLRVVTKGKGRQIPQELDLTLNISGFQDLINPALRAWLANQE